MLSSLGARHIVGSYFVLDKTLSVNEDGSVTIDAEVEPKFSAAIEAFTDSLKRHA